MCRGPQIPAAADVLEGDEVTSSPAVPADVEAAGSSWVDGVVHDGTLVTGQTRPAHPEWLAEFVDLLGGEVAHDEPGSAVDD